MLELPELEGRYITVADATQQLGVSYEAVKKACQRYRLRMEGRDSDQEKPDPERAARETREPEPHELACTWIGGGKALIYLVDRAQMHKLQLNTKGRGRKVGTRLVRDETGTRRTQRAGEYVPPRSYRRQERVG
jgi:ssDNA-binding replication factor A large subunit